MAGIPVQDIQNIAIQQASTATTNAVTAGNNMLTLLSSYWPRVAESAIGRPTMAPVEGGLVYAAANERVAVPTTPGFTGITVPTKPILGSFTSPDVGNIPDFIATEPILNFPVAPNRDMPADPGAPPEFVAPSMPAKPTFLLPDAPTFAPISLPDTPLVELPYFEADAEFGELIAPTERFEYSEQEYQSTLLDETKAKILNDILHGGYGIDDEDERRLWDRAREREAVAASTAMEEAARMAAARGFRLPPGTLIAQQDAAQQEYIAKNSSINREIAIKKADLYVENRKFALTTAVQIEDMLIRAHAATAERFLNAAKTQVELGVAIFNAQVQRYNAKVQAYASYASAFESRVRAALASVEIYKAQIDGARLTAETYKTYADIYQTQVNGVTALANLYKTEMEAAQIAASVEQIKLQAFKAQVEVYAEQIRARAVEFDMFEAQIKGEISKVQAYEASSRAYAARVSGFEAKARVAETTARTEIAQQGAQIDVYRADMEKFRAEVAARGEEIRSAVAKYDSQVREYAARVDGVARSVQATASTNEANSRNYIAFSQIKAEDLRAQVEQAMRHVQAGMQSNVQESSVMANLAGTWAGTVNGLSGYFETA